MKVVKLNIEKRTEKVSGYTNVKIEWEGNDISPQELDMLVTILYTGNIPKVGKE